MAGLDQSAATADDMVKVVNTRYNVSCQWPLSKLKEKLVKLRTLVYAVCTSQIYTLAINAGN